MSEEERRAEADRALANINETLTIFRGLNRRAAKRSREAAENAARLRDQANRPPGAE